MDLLRLASSTGSARAEIIPALGGMTRQIELDFGGVALPILSADTDEQLFTNPWFRGRLLLPFNDRIPQGKYSFAGSTYQLPANCDDDGSAIHGLLYNKPMRVIDRAPDQATLQCLLEGCPGYPFRLDVQIRYRIESDRFSLAVQATNAGSHSAPFAFGWHPYFQLGGPLEETTLEHGGETFVAVDDALMPTGELISVDNQPWDFRSGAKLHHQELDLAITASKTGTCSLSRGKQVLTLQADPSSFPYTQLFIPPDRKSVAVEPITAATDAFNRPELGLRELGAGETFRAEIVLSSSVR